MIKELYQKSLNVISNKTPEKIKNIFTKPITLQVDRDNEAKMINFSIVKGAIESNDLNRLLGIFQKILNCDLNMSGSLETRKDALLSLPFTFDAGAKEQKIIDKVLENFEFDDFLKAIANDMYYGISMQNIVYEIKENLVLPVSYKTIFPTNLNEEIKDNTSKLYFNIGNDKKLYIKNIDPNRLIIHKHSIDNSVLQNNSIAYKLLWSAILKHTIITLNLEFFDKAAVPPLIITVDDLSDEKKADDLFKAMMELKSTSIGMFTQDMKLDTLKFDSKADFEKSIEYIDKKMDKFILGGTLSSTSENTGSQALGNVHNERLLEKVRADSKLLNKTITRFFNQTLALNLASHTPVKFSFTLPQEKNQEELKVKSETIKNLSESGYVVPADEVSKMMNIKNITFKKVEAPSNNHIELNKSNSKDDDIDIRALEDEVMGYVGSIVKESNSYEEIIEKLDNEFRFMEFNKLEEILTKENIKSAIQGSLSAGNDRTE